MVDRDCHRGTVGEVPKWQGDGLEEALLEEDLTADPAETAEMIRNTVQDVVLPVREAAAGAGITVITAAVLARLMDLRGTIRQAAEGLADEFARMMSSFWLEACLAAAVLLAGGMLSLFLYRRGSMKAAGAESRISP